MHLQEIHDQGKEKPDLKSSHTCKIEILLHQGSSLLYYLTITIAFNSRVPIIKLGWQCSETNRIKIDLFKEFTNCLPEFIITRL